MQLLLQWAHEKFGFYNNPSYQNSISWDFPIILTDTNFIRSDFLIIRPDEISSVRIYHNEAPIEPRVVLKNSITGSQEISVSPIADLQCMHDHKCVILLMRDLMRVV